MAKAKTVYFCTNCGAESPKWLGKCPSCGEWNTYQEEVITKSKGGQSSDWKAEEDKGRLGAKPQRLSEIDFSTEKRYLTPDQELNRVLGGGMVPGSIMLIGGEPGIGKSTLMLQIATGIPQKKVLYISGEESAQQIKMRAQRMAQNAENCYILTETDLQKVFQQIKSLQPDLVIVDSIQTMSSQVLEAAAGTVSQVKECTASLLRYAKETQTPVFLIGHITKEGALAGPKVLEHMVDTVLQFEGDRHLTYRILRTIKNRFGSTSELGIYEMQSQGLRQVSNPSEILISQRDDFQSGVSVGASMEGNRPLLIETQSLVSPATYGTPQRSCTGYDTKRVNMLLAVLEKRGGFRLGAQDVFINIAGGLKIEDPAMDLAIVMALVSSWQERPLPQDICFAGEIGLGGEIRAVHRIENRIAEAEKLGFKKIVISKFHQKGLDFSKNKIEVLTAGTVGEVVRKLIP